MGGACGGMDSVESVSAEYAGDLLDIFGGKAPHAGRIWNEGYGFHLERECFLSDYVGPCKLIELGSLQAYLPTKRVVKSLHFPSWRCF
jgi:hypothetical protein